MAIAAAEYEILRTWSARFIKRKLPMPAGLPADAHPIAILDAMALKAPARATQGLAMMIGDLIELTSHLTPTDVKHMDAEFSNAGLPTLSEMRLRSGVS